MLSNTSTTFRTAQQQGDARRTVIVLVPLMMKYFYIVTANNELDGLTPKQKIVITCGRNRDLKTPSHHCEWPSQSHWTTGLSIKLFFFRWIGMTCSRALEVWVQMQIWMKEVVLFNCLFSKSQWLFFPPSISYPTFKI